MTFQNDNYDTPDDERRYYAGRWVACLGDKVIGQGGTPGQALRAAKASRFKETPQVNYIPTTSPLLVHPLITRIKDIIPSGSDCYLVGGAIRDSLLGKPVKDLDFVMPDGAIETAKKVADAIGGAFYPLDLRRKIGRVVIQNFEYERFLLDFSIFQGHNLESDLLARDFTINSMAVSVEHPQRLLDPLGGYRDLQGKIIQTCSPKSFLNDPVRIVRAIRFAAALNFHILPETRQLMHASIQQLPQVSIERLRDELFQILAGQQTAKAIHALDMLGAIQYILPELSRLKGVLQSPPHIWDVWTHTLAVLKNLELILARLVSDSDSGDDKLIFTEMAVTYLGHYRKHIEHHLNTRLVIDRSIRSLLFFAALYHDIGKPDCLQVDDQDRIHFIGHENISAEITFKRAKQLHLSNAEVTRLKSIVNNHLRPILLAQSNRPITRRAIYRFFRDCGESGIDICLLSMADVLGTFGDELPLDKWEAHLEVINSLLDAFWNKPGENLNPPPLVTGHDLIDQLGLKPGPQIGQILESIRESQVTGQISSYNEAIEFTKSLLNKPQSD
jgi:tRNA nucleotidyltransferase/poly(A) polymerase